MPQGLPHGPPWEPVHRPGGTLSLGTSAPGHPAPRGRHACPGHACLGSASEAGVGGWLQAASWGVEAATWPSWAAPARWGGWARSSSPLG